MARPSSDPTTCGTKPLKERLSAEALKQRLYQEHVSRELKQQAERLENEEAAFERQREEAERQVVGGRPRRSDERHRSKLQARRFKLLERDDAGVREILERERRIDSIVDGSQPTEVDELLWFMGEELKLIPALEALAPPEKYVDKKTGREVTRRRMYSALVLNLLGVISRYMGLSNGPEIQASLLTDPRWMVLLGFTQEEVLVGSTRRSETLVGKTRDGQGGCFEDAGPMGPARARLEGPRGALSSQTLSEHECTLEAEGLVTLFNAVVRALARRGLYPKEVRAALNSTGEEVVPSFQGAGRVRKKVKVQSRARRPRQVEVVVRGFKRWYLMEVETGLPLAFAFDTIEKPENEHARAVIDQARANLKGYSRLVGVALDRGFLDGDLLWWLKKERRFEAESPLETARRLSRGGRAHDGVTFFERQVETNRESLVVAQVDGLECTDFYGPGGWPWSSKGSNVGWCTHDVACPPSPSFLGLWRMNDRRNRSSAVASAKADKPRVARLMIKAAQRHRVLDLGADVLPRP